jgi:hypothetical protein
MKTEPTDSINYIPSSGQYAAEHGLTKRELFAAMAMQGFLSDYQTNASTQEFAKVSVQMADALIEELNK